MPCHRFPRIVNGEKAARPRKDSRDLISQGVDDADARGYISAGRARASDRLLAGY